MSMAAALSNMFSLDRQRARYHSERVSDSEAATADNVPEGATGEEDNAATTTTATTTTGEQERQAAGGNNSSTAGGANRRSSRRGSRVRLASSSSTAAGDVEEGRRNSSATALTEDDELSNALTDDDDLDDEDLDDDDPFGILDGNSPDVMLRSSNTMTLAELEEERELARRRSSACVLLAVFVLFKLWVEVIQSQDVTLLLLCLLGTSWTARWIRYNREREEELDRRIERYLQNNNSNGGDGENGDSLMDRGDLRMLSFQAQLALAIMESQRHMMEGGFGRPDGDGQDSPGVSEEAKTQWKRFAYKDNAASTEKNNGNQAKVKGDYGSVALKDPGADGDGADAPHCSICLGEYEDGEELVELPCTHLYHAECISSWTDSHVKCPLCNFDLESVVSASDSSNNNNSADDSIV